MKNSKTSIDQFESLFKESFDGLFPGLHRYALTLVKDHEKAKDVVQSIFAKWWEKQLQLEDMEATKAYLYTAVYRHCLNIIRHEKVKLVHTDHYLQDQTTHPQESADANTFEELHYLVEASIDDLPIQCKIIFKKSRMEEKRYAEIAKEMNLSVKTVEAQMGKALKILREKLKDYL